MLPQTPDFLFPELVVFQPIRYLGSLPPVFFLPSSHTVFALVRVSVPWEQSGADQGQLSRSPHILPAPHGGAWYSQEGSCKPRSKRGDEAVWKQQMDDIVRGALMRESVSTPMQSRGNSKQNRKSSWIADFRKQQE